ncbi:MAG: hypothetical protein ACXQTW_06265 [Candidatus Methanospirareceae archaeon]
MRLRLTESSELAIERADDEPFHSINQENGISVESFTSLLKEIETFISEFEDAIGMQGAATRIGERLHEAVHAGRTSIERHLMNQYFSGFEIKADTAYILIENYEMVKRRVGLLKRAYRAYDFTVLRFMLTRVVHEDTHSHIHKTEYSGLFSELVEKTGRRMEYESGKVKRLPFTAPIYIEEKEELAARRMQRFALNAFLKRYYEEDTEWYGLLGVPLFLPPHPGVVAGIKEITKGEVGFESGFLSTYRKILDEYACAIATSEEGIYEDAKLYLQSRTENLINLVKQCLEGDYSGLRTREEELVWAPDCRMKIHGA